MLLGSCVQSLWPIWMACLPKIRIFWSKSLNMEYALKSKSTYYVLNLFTNLQINRPKKFKYTSKNFKLTCSTMSNNSMNDSFGVYP